MASRGGEGMVATIYMYESRGARALGRSELSRRRWIYVEAAEGEGKSARECEVRTILASR